MCRNLSWGTSQQSEAENITHLESNAEEEVGMEDVIFRECPHLPPTPLAPLQDKEPPYSTLEPGCQEGWTG